MFHSFTCSTASRLHCSEITGKYPFLPENENLLFEKLVSASSL